MAFFKPFFLSICLLVSGQFLLAQSADTTLQITEILVTDSRLPLSGIGSKQERLDSMRLQDFQNNNLAEVLMLNNQAYVRSYGPGRLATAAIRGGAGVHTAVVWNGFNLQNPILGLTDLALFPVNFIDNARLEYGGGTALWGSGALGGVIHLNSDPKFGQGWGAQVRSSVGSFGNFTNSGNLAYSNHQFATKTHIFQQNVKNDFPYTTAAGEERELPNAAVQQFGILHEDYLRIAENQQLGLHVWWQQAERELPPTTLADESFAKQEDRILRLTADWKHIGDKLSLYARAGAFREQLNYDDANPAFPFSSEDVFWTAIGEVEGKLRFAKHQELNIGINNTWTEVNSPSLPGLQQQNRTALFAAYRFNNNSNTLRTVLSARQEVVEGDFIPFVPSLGIEFDLVENLTIKGAASRNYRLPSFSDLYSSFGGNSNLKPERGWSQELGIVYDQNFGTVNLRYTFTGFNRNIDNWIVWLPTDSTGFNYSPRNVLAVHSRGIENVLEIGWQVGDSYFNLIGKYDFVKSTNEEVAEENKAALGKQLLYIPQHKGLAQLTWRNAGWSVAYRHNFVGKVFTSPSNIQSLPAFSLGDLSVSRTFKFDQWHFSAFTKVHNLWDTDYQMVQYYPMPGRNFEVGLGFGF